MSKQIPLTKGKFAIIDDSDFERVNQFKWCAHKSKRSSTWYAIRHGARPQRKSILLHVFLMNPLQGMKIDHIDGNGLNSQRHNLRVVTDSQSAMNKGKHRDNTSGYKGVCKAENKWMASLTVEYKHIYGGIFSTPEEAAHVYDKLAKKHHGEFARLNFPEDPS
jgi:hypothetical protein